MIASFGGDGHPMTLREHLTPHGVVVRRLGAKDQFLETLVSSACGKSFFLYPFLQKVPSVSYASSPGCPVTHRWSSRNAVAT